MTLELPSSRHRAPLGAVRSRLSLLVSALLGCTARGAGLGPKSHVANPVGWPAKVLSSSGEAIADTGLPLLRETGALLLSLGDLLESPALLVEGVGLLRPSRFLDSGRMLLVGTGGTVTAALNLPFFLVTGGTVDVGKEAATVNDALRYLDERAADEEPPVFPKGTRVVASGNNLLWMIPDQGRGLQRVEVNPVFALVGAGYSAQERSWGFVVRSAAQWNAMPRRTRVSTIIHEFYHQYVQMRGWFLGWTTLYWPAYGYSYVFSGYSKHWAERSPWGASVVELALANWHCSEDPSAHRSR